MPTFEQQLRARLESIHQAGLYRELRRIDSPQSTQIDFGGRRFLNFSSNDYLGLATHPQLKAAAIEALERFGTGSGASRLLCGSLLPHHQLEERLAEFKGTPAALIFSSGYATAVGTITALVDKEDVVVLDKLVHASVVDAARLSGARLRVFAHNDLEELKDILQWARSSAGRRSVLILTESVFSMDGDRAPLRELVKLKGEYGAWLMLDEAHATGMFGANRRGLAEQEGVEAEIDVHMGTLGKALGSAGGYICGSRTLIDLLVNRARSFIFSTAPVPAASAATKAALDLVMSPEGAQRCRTLWQRVEELTQAFPVGPASATQVWPSAILPIPIGDETKAVEISAALRRAGVFIPAVRFPTVARGQARLRLSVSAAHTSEDIKELLRVLSEAGLKVPDFPRQLPRSSVGCAR